MLTEKSRLPVGKSLKASDDKWCYSIDAKDPLINCRFYKSSSESSFVKQEVLVDSGVMGVLLTVHGGNT